MRWLTWIYAVCKPIIIACGSERVNSHGLSLFLFLSVTLILLSSASYQLYKWTARGILKLTWKSLFYNGRVKRKSAFSHAKMHIQIILRMRKVSSGHLLSIHTFCSIQYVSGQWPWSDCADAQADLGLRCPHRPEETFSPGMTQYILHQFFFYFLVQVYTFNCDLRHLLDNVKTLHLCTRIYPEYSFTLTPYHYFFIFRTSPFYSL